MVKLTKKTERSFEH